VVRLDRAEWEATVAQFRDYSYRQAWAYGESLADKRGATSEHVAIRLGSETIALADVRIKRLPLIGSGLAYVSGGPLVRGLDSSREPLDALDLAVEALVREFVHRRGMTLRVAAPVGLEEHNQAVAERLERAGFVASQHAARYHTVLLDVDRPADELRASFH
jgi:hypothetical protein